MLFGTCFQMLFKYMLGFHKVKCQITTMMEHHYRYRAKLKLMEEIHNLSWEGCIFNQSSDARRDSNSSWFIFVNKVADISIFPSQKGNTQYLLHVCRKAKLVQFWLQEGPRGTRAGTTTAIKLSAAWWCIFADTHTPWNPATPLFM